MSKKALFIVTCFAAIAGQNLQAFAVWVETSDNQIELFDIDPETPVRELQILATHDEEDHLLLARASRRDKAAAKAKIEGPRDYYADVTPKEKEDIAFIITTLADKSHAKLLLEQGSLERAGNRVANVHPLRFMLTIFTDERLKVGIRNMHERTFVWGNFSTSFYPEFLQEQQEGNLTPEMINHFANEVEVSPDLFLPHIKNKNWAALMDTMVTQIPRHGDVDRYNM